MKWKNNSHNFLVVISKNDRRGKMDMDESLLNGTF